MTRRTFPIRTLPAGLAVLALLAAGPGAAWAAAEPPRVVAIGDIHGELEGFVGILKTAGLIDEELRWSGGDTILVQTGDFVDRGKDVRRVMDLLMAIQRQAPASGGEVIVLLGNHEQLNLVGELRPEYVTADICGAFADAESAQRRADAYAQWVAWQQKNPYFEPRSEEQWNGLYPLGYLEYVEAIGPDGEYGKWLRTLPVAVKVGATIFLHGGIGPEYLSYSIAKINKLHFDGQEALDSDRRFLVRQGTILPFFSLDELNQALVGSVQQRPSARMSEHEKYMFTKTGHDLAAIGNLLAGESPLWFRGYHSLSDSQLAELVAELNATYKAEHYVVAHTVQPSASIWARLDGAVFLIDTGMLGSHYGGRASALEIAGGRFTAIYPDDRTVLYDNEVGNAVVPAVSRQPRPAGLRETLVDLALAAPQYVGEEGYTWPGPDGTTLPFENHEQIEHYLAHAGVQEIEDIPVGVTKPKKLTLELDGVTAEAAFREINVSKDRQRMADGSIAMHLRDNYMNEIAAYKLGRLLGITNIPPVVLREIDGSEGSVQLWLEGALTEKQRVEEGKKAPDEVRFRRQVFDMDVFDALINNLDRNQGNILWDRDWNLWMIDHTRSFGRDTKLRQPEDVQMCSRRLYQALQGLDLERAKEVLKPYMGSFEISAFTKRHKELLKLLDEMIASEGEAQVIFEYE